MKRAYFLPVLALIGACLAVVVVLRDNRPASTGSPPVVVPEIPYPAYLAGAGIVEASPVSIRLPARANTAHIHVYEWTMSRVATVGSQAADSRTEITPLVHFVNEIG